jgi:hypothetical protein
MHRLLAGLIVECNPFAPLLQLWHLLVMLVQMLVAALRFVGGY